MSNDKRTIYVGGLCDEVTEQLIKDAFIPFGDIVDIQMPVDYHTQAHRGFAFVEYETAEDAAAAIDNMVIHSQFPHQKNEFLIFSFVFHLFRMMRN